MIYELCLCVKGYIKPYREDISIGHDGGATRMPTVA